MSNDEATVEAIETLTGLELLSIVGSGDSSLSRNLSATVPGWVVTGTPTIIEFDTIRHLPAPAPLPGPTFPAFHRFP
jgi:hypothetical protein